MTRKPKPLVLAGLIAAGIALVQSVMVLWFAWPGQNTEPRDLPIAIAGPRMATSELTRTLNAAKPRMFDVTVVTDARAADAALRDRRVYAALIVEATGTRVHIASAASPTVATMVSQLAQGLAAKQAAAPGASGTPRISVVDVVPTPADDPRGAGFTGGFLPLIMTSLACGIALLFLIASHRIRVAGLTAFSVLAGAVSAGLLHGRGVLTGNYPASACVITLLTLAISAAVSGLGAVGGNPGLGAGVITVFFFGNPISGMASAPEFLPHPWGTVGQLLPPGAGASMLRSVAFFDGAGALRPGIVLAVWAAGGLLLTLAGHRLDRRGRGASNGPVPAPLSSEPDSSTIIA